MTYLHVYVAGCFMRSVQMTSGWFEQLPSVALVVIHCSNNTLVTAPPNHRFVLFHLGQTEISLRGYYLLLSGLLICLPTQHYHIIGHPIRFIFLCTFANHLPQLYLTLWDRVILEELIDPHKLQKFPAFWGTQNVIAVVTITRHWFLSRVRRSSLYLPSYLLNVHFNIILTTMLRYFKWSFSTRFPSTTLSAFLFSM
jgi:hypothetical protein